MLVPLELKSIAAGSTHPSFSDIHLILPKFINRRIGLKTEADYILNVAIHTTEEFFVTHDLAQIRPLADQAISSRPARPMPPPGTLLLYDQRLDSASPSTSSASFTHFQRKDSVVELERVMSG
jgi:hypothetical protein